MELDKKQEREVLKLNLEMIDTHTHYAHKRFDCGRDEILCSLQEAGIKAVVEGAINYESNFKMQLLCEKYPFVYMAAGCHPNLAKEMDEEKFLQLKELIKNEKVIAIGETGLDYGNEKSEEEIQLQKYWFGRFLELSKEAEKPLVIHCRDAYEDLIEILESHVSEKKGAGKSAGSAQEKGINPGVIHCFSGNLQQARTLEKMGFYFGVNGKFTTLPEENEVQEALKNIPLERILLETDSPYLVPAGASGKRNTSLNLKYIVAKLADLRKMEVNEMLAVILENTRKLYPEIKI